MFTWSGITISPEYLLSFDTTTTVLFSHISYFRPSISKTSPTSPPEFGPGSLPPASTILLKSFQPLVALYLSIVPLGTYNFAFSKVFLLKTPRYSLSSYKALPPISNGFSINEIMVCMIGVLSTSPSKALYPMFVTLLGIVTEVRLVHSVNALNIENQRFTF